MTASPSQIVFYYDVVCPYAYLAATAIEALAARYAAEVIWTPVLLGGLLRHADAPDDPNAVMSAPRLAHTQADFERAAALAGVGLRRPPEHPRRTVAAMRLLVAVDDRIRPALSKAMFAAYWVDGKDVSDPDVIAEVAQAHAVDPAIGRTEAAKRGLFATTAEAAAAGAFGVPTCVAGSPGQVVWGQDRLWMVARSLGSPEIDPTLWAVPARRENPRGPIVFFHDFSSPFSYLASTQIERVAVREGTSVEWVPILLGGLFRSLGVADVPLFGMHPRKQAWVRNDLVACAAGFAVPFAFAEPFPIRSVLPLRVALVEPRATAAIYRAAWVERRDIATPATLASVLRDAGFDAGGILARADEQAIKLALRENTDRARVAGACGVPTFVVPTASGPMTIWGQDRLNVVTAALRGAFEAPARSAASGVRAADRPL